MGRTAPKSFLPSRASRLGGSDVNAVTAAQPVPNITADQNPGIVAQSGYNMQSAASSMQPDQGPAQNRMNYGGGGTDNQLDPNLRLRQPFFGNLY